MIEGGHLIYIKNRCSLKILPRGTTQFNNPASEKTSSTETKNFLFDR